MACYTLGELAELLDVSYQGDARLELTGLATLNSASTGQMSFLANPRYRKQLQTTEASAVIVSQEMSAECPVAHLISRNPYLTFAQATGLFNNTPTVATGIHPSAVVSETANIAASASVAAHCVIGEQVVIGENSVIGAGTVIGDNSRVGADCCLHANVSIYHDVHLGDKVIVHSAAVLGADGFGFAPSSEGWVKIHQLGGIRIGDRVEVGAGTTIDRGALDHTVLADGVILDNQVQIAHNVKIGKNTAIAGCTAVAGSVTIGANCTIAGGIGIVGHITIADKVHVTAMTLVTKSITEAGSYSAGTPMLESRHWKKSAVRFSQLDELSKRINQLEKQLKDKG